MKNKTIWIATFVAVLLISASISAQKQETTKRQEIIVLNESNFVLFDDVVTGASVSAAMSDMTKLLEKRGTANYPIYLVLDTPGGSVLAGYRLYEFLKPYKNIHTITIGSYSMGAILVELIEGERLIVETGTIMFHRMTTSLPEAGQTEELQGSLDYSKLIEETAEKRVSQRVGIPQNELRKKLDSELYLMGDEAVKQNFVDRIVIVQCDSKILTKTKKKLVQPMPFLPPMEIEVPVCPMVF